MADVSGMFTTGGVPSMGSVRGVRLETFLYVPMDRPGTLYLVAKYMKHRENPEPEFYCFQLGFFRSNQGGPTYEGVVAIGQA